MRTGSKFMAQSTQNTGNNPADSIANDKIPDGDSLKPSVLGRLGSYLRDSWSNRQLALALKQRQTELEKREQDLQEQLANFDRNSIRLVEGKAALADQRKALKEEIDKLQCTKDTFRAEREALYELTIQQAKKAAQLECDIIRESATKQLQAVDTEVGKKQAEIEALENRLRHLQEVLVGVTETVAMSLRESAGNISEKPYLVSSNDPAEVVVSVANGESEGVEASAWAASLFPPEKQAALSSSAIIASAACLRVGV